MKKNYLPPLSAVLPIEPQAIVCASDIEQIMSIESLSYTDEMFDGWI